MTVVVFEGAVHGSPVPQNWGNQPRFGTRSELLHSRRVQDKPHKSFDLDGDGFVGRGSS